MTPRPVTRALSGTLLVFVLAGCVPNDGAADGSGTTLTVDSSATACTVSATEAASGTLTFEVSNSGDEVTEFYLLADDGVRVIGEAENIGPGIQGKLVVVVEPGDYFTACKPGMSGTGVGKAPFTVTD